MREIVDRARELFLKGCRWRGMVDRRLALDLDLFSRGGMRVLEKIEQQDYDVLARASGDFQGWSACGLLLARWRGWRSRAGGVMIAIDAVLRSIAAVARSRAKNFYYSFVLLSTRSSATPCAPSTPSCATATI